MTPSRNPIGCVFCPMLLLTIDDDDHMARRAPDRGCTAHRRRSPPLQDRALIDIRLLHIEFIEIDVLCCLFRLFTGICDRWPEGLLDLFRSSLLRELEEAISLAYIAATDLVDHEPHLTCALAHTPRLRTGFHDVYLALERRSANFPP